MGMGTDRRGYGNHSCEACVIRYSCPLRSFIENENAPNSCSFYWPPSFATQKPSSKFLKLRQLYTDKMLKNRDVVMIIKK
jgi:hypothetical protein